MREIPLSVPNLSSDIVDNLQECIESGWVSTGGKFIGQFEQKMAQYLGVLDAVSVQSGTAGLHLAMRALGLGSGDEVLVPSLTFIAAVNPVRYMGASPVFMDCDASFCMDPDKLECFLREECLYDGNILTNKGSGRVVKAVLVVHVFGNLADMDRIMTLAEAYGLKVVEDATEALGSYFLAGKYKGKYGGTVGDIGVFSFNANKIITTGGGGMIVSQNPEDLEYMRYLSLTAKDDALFFKHDEVGYNYRMLNIQAALGVSQIDKLESFIEVKKENYQHYKSCIKEAGLEEKLQILSFRERIRPNFWFYSLLVNSCREEQNRDWLMRELIEGGIQCRPVWTLVNRQKPYQMFQSYKIEQGQYYESNILNLPCSSSLRKADVEHVVNYMEQSIKKMQPAE